MPQHLVAQLPHRSASVHDKDVCLTRQPVGLRWRRGRILLPRRRRLRRVVGLSDSPLECCARK